MTKGLKALRELRKQCETHKWLEQQFEKEWLDTIEKELKALEIIKEKKPKLDLLFISFEYEKRSKESDPDFYNNGVFKPKQLSQEKYELLKEVLS